MAMKVGEIPEIDECQRAPGQGHGNGLGGMTQQPGRFQTVARGVEVQNGGDCQQQERYGQHVGMEVAQQEAEGREFGDGVIDELALVGAAYDAGAAEPPPEFSREYPSGSAARVESIDADPAPESFSSPASQANELQGANQVSGQQHQHRGEGAGADGPAQFAARHPHEVVDQPEADRAGQRGQRGDAQVVPHGGHHCAHLGERGDDEVAEVVVADGVAGQPSVLGREVPGLVRRVQQHEVHGLFGVGDARRARDHQGPRGEHEDKDQLGGQQHPPVVPEELAQLGPLAADQPGRSCPDAQRHDPDGQLRVGQQVKEAEQPDQVGHDQQGGRFCQRQSPVGKESEEEIGPGERRQAQKLKNDEPRQYVDHRLSR